MIVARFLRNKGEGYVLLLKPIAIAYNNVYLRIGKTMLLAHKIELRPTLEQRDYLDRACGHRRHCYNQLLEYFSQKDEAGQWVS